MTIEPSDFAFLRGFIHKESAIVLEPGKEYLVESRLGPLVRHYGLQSIAELLGKLKQGAKDRLAVEVVEALTTNETSFFRDIHPFEALKTAIVPEVMKARKAVRRLRIWSAACSTGQEPYTIAMTLRENFKELDTWDVKILATDITTAVLDRARAGKYRQLEVNRGLPASLLVKYFTKVGADWEVSPLLRQWVDFRQMNLSDKWSIGDFDIVFIRNVLIYFDVPTKKTILGKIRRSMPTPGYLLLGGAETTMNLDDGFERVQLGGGVFYRKRS